MPKHTQHLNDDYSADARPVRMKWRADEHEAAPSSKGRLTLEGKAKLGRARDEADRPPPEGDRWSSWVDADQGPDPLPDWVITSAEACDHDLGVLKTGKEADVFLVRRAVPGTDDEVVLAAKRYRSNEHRTFHRDAGYLEGRRLRRTRDMRAIENRTAFGRNLIAEQWAVAEFGALSTLWPVGVPVPYPVQRYGTELLIEYLDEEDGSAAPRLAQVKPNPDELADLWGQLVSALTGLAEHGLTHGDLSPYNILVHRKRLMLIDLPQIVDVVANPNGGDFLARDVKNITTWFLTRGLPSNIGDPDALLEMLRYEARIA